ncbi:MAG TPA: thiolase family protein [Actinomycetota bacterium]|jgi:acetyl-CoA acyltransferase|nr:thiolase family protein [Actinomycetes bacterium]HEX5880486.1 thiolase family protein [Actinomycetota bacterium]
MQARAQEPGLEPVVVGAVRTPVGKRNGALAGVHAVDLGAVVLRALVERSEVDPVLVDDVIMGCVSQVGEQSLNVARNAWLAAGLPEEVPATTIDRQCGSSQQAVQFAAQGIMAGGYRLVVAGGVEHMTRVPMGSTMSGPGVPFGPAMHDRYQGRLVPQGISAELITEKWGLTREEQDEFALRSHRRAAAAQDAGRFDRQLVPVEVPGPDGGEGGGPTLVRADEGVRRDTSMEKLAGLKPAFRPDGQVTAGNSSQISDGAAALLLASRETAERLGLRPLARFAGFALAGVDPVLMLTGVIPATERVLRQTGLGMDDLDVIEINEAFASVVLSWGREVEPNWDRVNPNGGAIALGHPLGASGARIMTDLVAELERGGGRYGLQVMCEGGGMANATVLERLDG